jgi:ribosome-associated protein
MALAGKSLDSEALVRRSLEVPKARRPTRPTSASRERRLSEKKRAAERKRRRSRPADDA